MGYKEVLAEVRDRLGGIDDRLTGIDDRLTTMDERVTKASEATRKEIAQLRQTVNDEQAKQDERISDTQKFVHLRRAIERGCIWIIGTSVAVSGLVVGLIKFILG